MLLTLGCDFCSIIQETLVYECLSYLYVLYEYCENCNYRDMISVCLIFRVYLGVFRAICMLCNSTVKIGIILTALLFDILRLLV
jgi:hypothetical protein